MQRKEPAVLVMSSNVWLNSQLSAARFYGGVQYGGFNYVIVPAANDLVYHEAVKAYNILGRDALVEMACEGRTLKEINAAAKAAKQASKHGRED